MDCCHARPAGQMQPFSSEGKYVMLSEVIKQEHCICLSNHLFAPHMDSGWSFSRPAGCGLWRQSICGTLTPEISGLFHVAWHVGREGCNDSVRDTDGWESLLGTQFFSSELVITEFSSLVTTYWLKQVYKPEPLIQRCTTSFPLVGATFAHQNHPSKMWTQCIQVCVSEESVC